VLQYKHKDAGRYYFNICWMDMLASVLSNTTLVKNG